MPLNSYQFRTTWSLPSPADAVFAALVDLARYPEWWPDIRSVTQVDDDTAELVCRASLPFALRLRMTRVEENRPGGRVAVALSGDLEGMLSGRLEPRPGGTRLAIRQRVVAHKPVLRRLSPVAHPVFRINHALMMRRGLRGLRTHLTRPEPA
ncbi:SRPBCC family protein [Prauserella rugosa]|uniref:Polyketide cyclase/dehydrase/lipid transport protein n=1 Tax=Prauserella rugosa TaxID=43354 RepID=A0A660CG35_9PSEU|nr:SRPBCC family protein [Prauserella rugosa]KMS88824.1 polyketide cyclase [Streptomyces regensis]TWH19865.1 polyketide cyclase/dehydrase/lipid transport protein [Prauserella rugosa]